MMQLRFDAALPLVQTKQQQLESQGTKVQAIADEAYLKATTTVNAAGGGEGQLGTKKAAVMMQAASEALTLEYLAFARTAVKAWWVMSDDLLFTFADGYLNQWESRSAPSSPPPLLLHHHRSWRRCCCCQCQYRRCKCVRPGGFSCRCCAS